MVPQSYTAKFAKIDSGYIGRRLDWLKVATEASTVDECNTMFRAILHETLVLAYRHVGQWMPVGNVLLSRRPAHSECQPQPATSRQSRGLCSFGGCGCHSLARK